MNRSLRLVGLLVLLTGGLSLLLWQRTNVAESGRRESGIAPLPLAAAAAAAPAPTVPAAAAAEGASTTPSDQPELAAFNTWAAAYLAAAPEAREPLVAQGIALAQDRRPALRRLIESDPRAALESAVPPIVRQALPGAVAELLEERLNERAFFGVLGIVPAAGEESRAPYQRELRTADGGRYRAFVYGRRLAQTTTADASVVGIAVDDLVALDERPLRVVAPGEIPNHPNNLTRRRTVSGVDARGYSSEPELRTAAAPEHSIVSSCPVSGKVTRAASPAAQPVPAVAAGEVVVEAAGEFHFLCSGGHITTFEESLVAGEGGNGGPGKPTATIPFTKSTGYRTHVLMRVAFPEARNGSVTEKEGHDLAKNVQDWFVDASAGRLTFLTTVTPLLILPRTEAWYKSKDTGSAFEVLTDARTAAREAGFDWIQFDFDTVIYTGTPGSFGGQAYVGGRGCWLKSGTGTGVAVHEYGHNFSLWHANFWNTTDASPIGAGAHVEYGDSFDTMGSASAGDFQFNAYQKNILNWIPAEMVTTATASGTFRIYQMDQPRQDSRLRYALVARKDATRNYWIDLRQRFASNAWVQGGVFLHWSPWTASASGSHLLDMTPGSPDGKNDAPLVIGRTFSDRESGVHVTPFAKVATIPPSVDVVLNFGSFPGNSAPTLELTTNVSVAAVNAGITFTAAATDPDRDALSYAWDFGDKSFSTANAAVVTKAWATAGVYRVRCTASDMKGRTTSRSAIVTIGSTSTFRIAGSVTAPSGPLADVRVHNGLSGTTYREAYTDADGTFTLVGLSAATYSVGAQLTGYTFSTANVPVGPSATGIALAATELPLVTIAPLDADLAEGSNTGSFRITRTGSTAAALTVSVLSPTGTAVSGSDYTLNPTLTSGTPFSTLIIAAGQAALDVLVTATDDSTTESFETLSLTLAPAATYVIGESTATLILADNETPNPLVRLRVTDNSADESGHRGQFLIERVGSTAAALTVNFSVSGTATTGTDFTPLGTSAVIPAGASSVALNVVPVQNTTPESVETVIVTLSTASAYVRASATADNTGTVYLVDDDQCVVSITASDAAANEAGSDPGVFTLTRTGDLSQALTVSYGLTGSALHGTDYAALAGSVIFAAGSPVATVVITPIDDGIGEPAQTAVLQLQASPAYALGAATSATVTITDNSDGPYVTINAIGAPANESGTTGTFRVTTTGTGTGNITVSYTVSGTATAGTDFAALTGTLSIARNTTGNITITPLQDTLAEGYETITLTLNPDPAYGLALDSSATMNLQDDELPQVNVSTTLDAFSETNGSLLKFFVSRTGATTNALAVDYTLSGSATAGTDYTAPSGSVTIPAAAAGASVDISMLADALAEGTETVVLTIAESPAYAAGIASATRYINDAQISSVPRTVGFSASTSSAAESAGTVNLTVTLSAAATDPVTVDYYLNGGSALAGGVDYTAAASTLDFAPGDTTRTIPVQIANDTLKESSETVVVTLISPLNARLGTSAHTLTITDDDTLPPATVGFAATTGSGFEATSPAVIAVTLSSIQGVAVTVDYAVTGGGAVNGSDYAITAGTLSFAAGETVKLIPNSITNDTSVEGSETLVLTLSNAVGTTLSPNVTHTYGILDDDAATVTLAASDAIASEPGNDPGTLTLTRTGPTTAALTVNLVWSGTATPGADYVLVANSVSIPAGSATANLAITPFNDADLEGDETVTATLALGAYTIGAAPTATVTVRDDESVLTIAATDATAAESGDPASFTITRAGGNAFAATVNAAIGGTATAGADYTSITLPLAFPAGAATLVVPVVPVADADAENSETVTLTLLPGAYAIGAAQTAIVTIEDRPAVTIAAVNGAAEAALVPGAFLLSRTGPTTAALSVVVDLSGSATAGLDYVAIPSPAVIPAGASSITVPVVPLADAAVEGAEEITLTLQPAPAYVVLSLATASIPIADLPADEWRTQRFGAAAASPEIAGDDADPDADGINNLLEYAFNLDPLGGDTGPTISDDPATIGLIYRRYLPATDLTFTLLEAEFVAGPWNPATASEEILDDNGTTRLIRASVPRSSAGNQWLRLRVVRETP